MVEERFKWEILFVCNGHAKLENGTLFYVNDLKRDKRNVFLVYVLSKLFLSIFKSNIVSIGQI